MHSLISPGRLSQGKATQGDPYTAIKTRGLGLADLIGSHVNVLCPLISYLQSLQGNVS